MNQIVIATDGSPSAQEAVDVGLELAKEQGADVTFVHVTPPDAYVYAGRLGPVETLAHREEVDESEMVLEAAAGAAEEAGISYALERIAGKRFFAPAVSPSDSAVHPAAIEPVLDGAP